MLSNPLHRFSPYHAIPSSTSHAPADAMHNTGGLDSLAPGSHSALQQLQHHVELQVKHRQSSGGPVRRRISRACDQCNQLRTKCDGQHPCAHCIEFGLGCEYIRERKKRGKASRKDLARQAAAQAAAAGVSQDKMDDGQDSGDSADHHDGNGRSGVEPAMAASGEQNSSAAVSVAVAMASDTLMRDLDEDVLQRSQRTGSMESLGDMGSIRVQQQHQQQQSLDSSPVTGLDLNGYGPVHPTPYVQRQTATVATDETTLGALGAMGAAHMMSGVAAMSGYPDLPYTLQTLGAYPMGNEPASPPWLALPSPPAPPPPQQQQQQQRQQQQQQQQRIPHIQHQSDQRIYHQPTSAMLPHATTPRLPRSYNATQLRYPVLEPLAPHLGGIIPLSLACDLIDLYFSSSSSAQMHPMSPYVISFVFRKRSFLHPTNPRPCQPALLASMLWVAAQTSDAPFLTRLPSARCKTCQKLLELTVGLLKPLVHAPSSASDLGSSIDSSILASMSAIGVMSVGESFGMDGGLAGISCTSEHIAGGGAAFGAAGTLDDVITYMHLATVVSASEYKGASVRWWNAAWSLARELKLGRELPPNPPSRMANPLSHQWDGAGLDAGGEEEDGLLLDDHHPGLAVSEEEREERRRIWWLVYLVDRHLALCYNRPLFLLDVECENLLQPMDETAWQDGEFTTSGSAKSGAAAGSDADIHPTPTPSPDDGQRQSGRADDSSRPRGPTFTCRGHSIFGFFLPLMTILGEIVDLHHLRNHPRFGVSFYSSREWKDQVAEITRHLDTYQESLRAFEQQHLSPAVLAAAVRKEQLQQQQAEVEAAEKSGNASHPTPEAGNGDANVSRPPLAMHTPPCQRDGSAAPADFTAGPAACGPVLSPSSSSSSSSSPSASPRMTELDIQTSIVTAYGTHVMHVLHVLLIGKWDPISLLDDDDLWISSPSFITATGHAVAAAEAISRILEHDPGLEFMPFYFGIYLLQGSFLLLLIADKLQLEASASVTRACEAIVRAHEACVVTLNTEYQRNFSRVMRSALAQVRGRVPPSGGRDDGGHGSSGGGGGSSDGSGNGSAVGCRGCGSSCGCGHHGSRLSDCADQPQRRRRELLGLYRWTGDGTGLAL